MGQLNHPSTIRIPQIDAASHPACPSWLGKVGKAKWKETLATIAGSQVSIQSVDADFLAMYCQAFDDLAESLKDLKDNGYTTTADSGAEYPSPAVARKNKAIDNIRRFGIELNLSPKRRTAKPKSTPLSQPKRQRPA